MREDIVTRHGNGHIFGGTAAADGGHAADEANPHHHQASSVVAPGTTSHVEATARDDDDVLDDFARGDMRALQAEYLGSIGASNVVGAAAAVEKIERVLLRLEGERHRRYA